jgi:molybdenum cofactor synthesis domain-containing protein
MYFGNRKKEKALTLSIKKGFVMAADMEIVCVGNELLIGKVVNTNASWMGKRATSLGIDVKRVTVVADDIEEMVQAFREVFARKPKFAIITGGLGPTFDDKTLEGLAYALNRKLEVNPQALDMVKAKYREYATTRGRPEGEMTPARVKMATIPEETQPIRNPSGTAPGVRVDIGGTIVFSLPGVPKEMEAIFEASIVPLLRQASGEREFFELSIYTDRLMESTLAPFIDKVMHDNPHVYIKSHPKGRENVPNMGELHFSTSGNPSENPQQWLTKAATELSALIEKEGGKIIKLDNN